MPYKLLDIFNGTVQFATYKRRGKHRLVLGTGLIDFLGNNGSLDWFTFNDNATIKFKTLQQC